MEGLVVFNNVDDFFLSFLLFNDNKFPWLHVKFGGGPPGRFDDFSTYSSGIKPGLNRRIVLLFFSSSTRILYSIINLHNSGYHLRTLKLVSV